jgi:hypothetical protein
MGKSQAFDDALASFALTYAHQTISDHAASVKPKRHPETKHSPANIHGAVVSDEDQATLREHSDPIQTLDGNARGRQNLYGRKEGFGIEPLEVAPGPRTGCLYWQASQNPCCRLGSV